MKNGWTHTIFKRHRPVEVFDVVRGVCEKALEDIEKPDRVGED